MDGFYKNTSPMEAVLNRLRLAGPDMNSHLQLMEERDWASTSLGPINTWSQELATQFFLTMLIPSPQDLVLGPDKIVIYNIAFGHFIRDYHPLYFGKPVGQWTAWMPYFSKMVAIYENAEKSGRAYVDDDFQMHIANNGYEEEVHFSCAVICLPPPLNGFLGTFNETTSVVAQTRRNLILQELMSSWGMASTLDSLWRVALKALSSYPEDFPFVALFTGVLAPEVANHSDSSSNDSEDSFYTLGGLTGDRDPDLLEAPTHIDLNSKSEPFAKYLNEAWTTRAPVEVEGRNIPKGWQQVAQSRGFGDACRSAMVCPSSSNRLSRVQAFFVVGLSPRTPYDDSYRDWVSKLQREFADIVASIISAQEAARRKREATRRAKVERDLLEKEIALRKKEAELHAGRVEKVIKIAGIADVGIYEIDLSGEVTFANDAFYEITGYPRDQLPDLGVLKQSLVVEEDRAIAQEHWDALNRGEPRTYELRYENGNWGLCSCVPIRDDSGKIESVIGVVTNIEAQKRAEQEAMAKVDALEKVQAGERRFYRFLEIVPAGILIMNPAGKVTFATDEWFKLTGCPVCPLDDIDYIQYIHAEDRALIEESWKTLSVEGRPVNLQVRVSRQWTNAAGQASGNSWVMCKALPEFNDDGSVQQVVSTITDISHLKFAESVQRSRVDEAVEAKRQQENFVDMTSHEIRNPLSAVIHCADSVFDSLQDMSKLVLSWKSAAKGRETISETEINHLDELIESGIDAVDTISSCSAHQKRIVDDILTLSKLDANLLRIAPSIVRTGGMLQDIQKMFEVEASRVGVGIETIADESIERLKASWVVIDPGRVMQVLINLVTNAIKFTKAASERQVTVRMGASLKRPLELQVDFTLARSLQDSIFDAAEFAENTCYLWFTVSDTGCGMTAQEKSRIFSRFAQGSIRTYNAYGGSGLGLFISRTLVELQGGEIGAASEPGKGSMFAFFVRTRTSTPPAAQGSVNALSHQISPDNVPTDGSDPISVLIVEDNAVNQRVLKKGLLKKGYIVHVADDGQQALDFLATTRNWEGNQTSPSAPIVDVILLDIEMPVMNGLDCALNIRRLQKSGDICTPNLPIIAASANARAEQVGMAIEAGMDDSITKPFRIPDLTPKIDSFAAWARSKKRNGIAPS